LQILIQLNTRQDSDICHRLRKSSTTNQFTAKARKGFKKMNDQQLENKVGDDTAKVKKDIGNLVEDGTAQISRLIDKVSDAPSKAKEDLTYWVEDGVSELSKNFEKLTGDAREVVVGAVATMKKDIGHGLSQYNAKAQEFVDKVPGGFGKKAASYPWVAISIALVVGFVLGSLLKPARQPLG
jgi:ElaB/YqjD/DUF883 family membrane-anchored ribosome-binding protein